MNKRALRKGMALLIAQISKEDYTDFLGFAIQCVSV